MPTHSNTTKSITMTVQDNLPARRIAHMRIHPRAHELGNGWLMIDDTNIVGDSVVLISQHAPVLVRFEHTPPYADHMRAYIHATVYADQFPQHSAQPSDAALLVAPLFHSAAVTRDEDGEDDDAAVPDTPSLH